MGETKKTTLEMLLNLLVRCGILTPHEGQLTLMTGILPDDILIRLKEYQEQWQ